MTAALIGLLLVMTGIDGAVHAHSGACPGGHCNMSISDHPQEIPSSVFEGSDRDAAHDHAGLGDDGCGPFTCNAIVLPLAIEDEDFAAPKVLWATTAYAVATPVKPENPERLPNA